MVDTSPFLICFKWKGSQSPFTAGPISKTTAPPLSPSFGFYHASGSHSDLVIALRKEDPNPSSTSQHSGWSSEPSAVLHASGSKMSSRLVTAEFSQDWYNTTNLVSFQPGPGAISAPTHQIKRSKDGIFINDLVFRFLLPGGK